MFWNPDTVEVELLLWEALYRDGLMIPVCLCGSAGVLSGHVRTSCRFLAACHGVDGSQCHGKLDIYHAPICTACIIGFSLFSWCFELK